MLVYDDVITRITVFCILFLLDDAQHQRNQTDTSDKHQQRYQQFTGIAQLRRQIQARSYRTKGGNNSLPKTSTRSLPRNTATRFNTTTAKAFTLTPPAVDCEPPPTHIRKR